MKQVGVLCGYSNLSAHVIKSFCLGEKNKTNGSSWLPYVCVLAGLSFGHLDFGMLLMKISYDSQLSELRLRQEERSAEAEMKKEVDTYSQFSSDSLVLQKEMTRHHQVKLC